MFYEKPILERVLPFKASIVLLQISVGCQSYNKETQRKAHSLAIFTLLSMKSTL